MEDMLDALAPSRPGWEWRLSYAETAPWHLCHTMPLLICRFLRDLVCNLSLLIPLHRAWGRACGMNDAFEGLKPQNIFLSYLDL